MRYIITGGPGFWKTSIITELKKRGFKHVGESSRKLINKLKLKEGKDPRENREKFQNLIVKEKIKDFFNNNQDIIFFDRGMPDEIAYSVFYKHKPTNECITFCENHKYNKVFITPPWKEIYKNDDLRNESYQNAIKLHNIIVKTYKNLNYK